MVYRKTSKVERKDIDYWNDIDGWDANDYDVIHETCECIDKLGEIENFEEEIGLYALNIFEVLKASNIYDNKGKRYDNSNSLSYFGNSWSIYNASAKKHFKPSEFRITWTIEGQPLED